VVGVWVISSKAYFEEELTYIVGAANPVVKSRFRSRLIEKAINPVTLKSQYR